MSVLPIRIYPDPVLRTPADEVTVFDADLARLVDDMIDTMHHHNGAGLAAPQVGVSKRVFVYGCGGREGHLINPVWRAVGEEHEAVGDRRYLASDRRCGLRRRARRIGEHTDHGVDARFREVSLHDPAAFGERSRFTHRPTISKERSAVPTQAASPTRIAAASSVVVSAGSSSMWASDRRPRKTVRAASSTEAAANR